MFFFNFPSPFDVKCIFHTVSLSASTFNFVARSRAPTPRGLAKGRSPMFFCSWP